MDGGREPPFAELDRDVTAGGGAETVRVRTAGLRSLRIAVHNYSNEVPISASKASLVVTLDGRVTLLVPSQGSSSSTWWIAAEYDHENAHLERDRGRVWLRIGRAGSTISEQPYQGREPLPLCRLASLGSAAGERQGRNRLDALLAELLSAGIAAKPERPFGMPGTPTARSRPCSALCRTSCVQPPSFQGTCTDLEIAVNY